MWTDVKKILSINLKKLGLIRVVQMSELCLKWDEMVENIFGTKYTKKTRPVSFKDKILIVDCLSSSWASEFQFKKREIIDEANKIFKKAAVDDIRFIS